LERNRIDQEVLSSRQAILSREIDKLTNSIVPLHLILEEVSNRLEDRIPANVLQEMRLILVLMDESAGLFSYIYCLHFLSSVSVKSHLLGNICAIFSKIMPNYRPQNTALNLLTERVLERKLHVSKVMSVVAPSVVHLV
jgi:hypothetical protein